MDNSWLPTEQEISSYQEESKDETIERLSRTVDYLMSENEVRQQRKQGYTEKQAKNPHRFVRFYRLKNKELSKSNMLNNTDKAFLFDVLPYINRESNIITSDRGIPMVAKEIYKELGISKATFYTITKKLIECGVVTQVPYENKIFFKLNPEYFDY